MEADPADAGAVTSIVTLAPHLAELVHTAGAGDYLVGVSAYSDYPADVRTLPQVGDAFLVDQERLAVLAPDLVLAWASGTPAATVDELRRQGYRVEVLRTQGLADVAAALRRIGRLMGTGETADAAADRFEHRLRRLRQAGGERIRVFYQIAARPLYTVNGGHYVSELIELCGGRNVFADIGDLAAIVAEEAVLARDPEMFLAGGRSAEDAASAFSIWQRWDGLAANRYGNFFVVDPNLLGRATTRLAEAGRRICDHIDHARAQRGRNGAEGE